jgi:hypothetical protein
MQICNTWLFRGELEYGDECFALLLHFNGSRRSNKFVHFIAEFPSRNCGCFQLKEIPPTSEQSLSAAQTIGREIGLKNVNIVSDKSCD